MKRLLEGKLILVKEENNNRHFRFEPPLPMGTKWVLIDWKIAVPYITNKRGA